jgi:hypothetical protein
MKRKNWMGFAKKQVERGKIHTSPGLLKRIAQRARTAAGEARAAKKRALEKEAEADRYYKELRASAPKGGYKWPSTKRTKAGKDSGRTLSDLLYGRNPKMAKKKRRKKRKKAMPAGLKAYWAKKRAAKNGRKRRRTRRRKVSKVRNYRRRRVAKRRAAPRRRRANPISKISRITLPAMSPAATKKTIALIKRLAGSRRVRVK